LRVLLTGASGFIGAQVASELSAAGADVRGFSRSAPPPEVRLSTWVRGDVRDPRAVLRAMRGCEAVVHAAALYSYCRPATGAMEEVNVQGTRNVVEAAVRSGIRRLVATSTSATCGPVPGRPATEHDSPLAWEMCVPYKRTKLMAERVVLGACGRLEAVCVNPTTTVGPGDRRPTPSGKMIRDLIEGRMRAYVRGAGINVVSVEDVATGHVLALERGRNGERYILGGDDLWLRDVCAIVVSAVGRKPPRLGVPWRAAYAAALAADRAERLVGADPGLLILDEVRLARLPLFFSSQKARDELGYRARPAARALAAAARWSAASTGGAALQAA
jgi:dihydroflavonol-4-reductase